MKIVIFGLSITSSWGNGHATTFRALARALHARGHRLVFFEKDVEWYASNRDLPDPGFCELHLYDFWSGALPLIRRELASADVAMVGSYFPDGIAAVEEMLNSKTPIRTFYDIDTPITVATLRESGATEYIRANQLPALDVYFSFTGGRILSELENRFGVRHAAPLYCSFDPERYRAYPRSRRFSCALSYMGTYAPDRQPKLESFLCGVARALPQEKFIVAGPQYPSSVQWPQNVRRITHLNPRWHPHLYSSSRLTLNITRRDMVLAGYSPSVRLFEAAACGAAIVSDNWPGLDSFFQPAREILLPTGPEEIVRYLSELDESELRAIGLAAQRRVLAEHTSQRRAEQFEREIEAAYRGIRDSISNSEAVR
ncbi:MAG: glycosyltransferase [Acidobacteria bacterium]|nr:MAG: glycosyltransferase [Acidobacteriota bacterium]